MIHKNMTSSAIALALASMLVGCNSSNEEGLSDVISGQPVDIPLVCQAPDTIKVDSFGKQILDAKGAPSCERVELACVGQVYDPIAHTCNAKGRHKNAPREVADAHTEGRPDFATLFFNREGLTADALNDGYIIHAWNNESCNAYDPDYIQPGATQDPDAGEFWGTDWATGVKPDGFDPNYGLYWTFKLLENHSECVNFIVHIANDKFPDGDMVAYVSRNPDSPRYNEDRMSYVLDGTTVVGNASVFPYYSEPGDPTDGLREINPDRAAHWFNLDTLLLADNSAASVRVYSTTKMPTLFPGEGYRGVGDYVEFVRATDSLSESEQNRALYRSGMTQYVASTPNDPAKVKEMLKGRLVAVVVDDNNDPYAGYLMQTAGVLDALYTSGEDDADEAQLGIIYNGSSVTAAVWAPTASKVALKLYADNYAEQSTMAMKFDANTGIWSYQGDRADLDRKLFRYEVSVYHPVNDKFETLTVIDPYAVSVTTNGRYARFVDLNDDDLKPADWDNHTVPAGADPEDIVIYEGHIRDFSIMDESTPAEHRGKYLAFAQQNTAPVNHLKALADAGLTHFQVLPSNDMASIEEDAAKQVNLSDTVAALCAKNKDLALCSAAADGDMIYDALKQMDPTDPALKAALEALRSLDGFNWGYDPYVFNAPEGSYASNPESVARIVEIRSMVKALHDMGLRTSLDVVYNHTSSSGLWDNSVLDKLVLVIITG